MAIDPSLSLQVNPVQAPDYLKFANFGLQQQLGQQKILESQQNIAASQTGQALAEAQTANQNAMLPGNQALSQQQVFAAKKQQDIKDIVASNTIKTVDPVTGKITVDDSNVAPAMTAAGYGSDAFDYIKGGAAAGEQQAKTATDQAAWRDKQITTLAATVQALPIDKQEQAWNSGTKALVQAHPEMIQGDPRFGSGFANPDGSNGLTYSPGVVAGIATGSITPKDAAQLAIDKQNAQTASINAETNRQQLKFNQAQGWDTPQGHDPADPLAVSVRAAYKAATGVTLPDNTPLFAVKNMPGGEAAINAAASSSVIPITAKTKAYTDNVANTDTALQYKSATTAAQKLLDTDPQAGTVIGSTASSWFANKVAQDGSLRAIQPGIDAYNQRHGYTPDNPQFLSIAGQGIPAVIKAINQDANTRLPVERKANDAIISGTNIKDVNAASPANPANTPTTPAAAPTPMSPAQIQAERITANNAIESGASKAAVKQMFREKTGQEL